MTEHTLTVPEQYAEDFRLALIEEIQADIGSLKANRKALAERRWRHEKDRPNEQGDVRGSERLLKQDVALATQIGVDHVPGPIEIRIEDIATVQFACETMAQQVIGPRLTEALACTPIDARYVDSHVRPLIEAISWATEQAAQLEGKWRQADCANEAA